MIGNMEQAKRKRVSFADMHSPKRPCFGDLELPKTYAGSFVDGYHLQLKHPHATGYFAEFLRWTGHKIEQGVMATFGAARYTSLLEGRSQVLQFVELGEERNGPVFAAISQQQVLVFNAYAELLKESWISQPENRFENRWTRTEISFGRPHRKPLAAGVWHTHERFDGPCRLLKAVYTNGMLVIVRTDITVVYYDAMLSYATVLDCYPFFEDVVGACLVRRSAAGFDTFDLTRLSPKTPLPVALWGFILGFTGSLSCTVSLRCCAKAFAAIRMAKCQISYIHKHGTRQLELYDAATSFVVQGRYLPSNVEIKARRVEILPSTDVRNDGFTYGIIWTPILESPSVEEAVCTEVNFSVDIWTRLPSLRSLDTVQSVQALQRNFHGLLHLEELTAETGESGPLQFWGFPALTSLDLPVPLARAEEMANALGACPNLTSLTLRLRSKGTDGSFEPLWRANIGAKTKVHLRCAHWQPPPNFGPPEFALLPLCAQVVSVRIFCAEPDNDDTLSFLSELPRLEELHLRLGRTRYSSAVVACPALTFASLRRLTARFLRRSTDSV